MRAVIQRVKRASVEVEHSVKSTIGKGLLIFLGIENADSDEDIDWLCRKLSGLRIFSDEQDKMNLSIQDIQGDFLIISQFTLHASTKKGNRPSFINAAKPDVAVPLYEKFLKMLAVISGREVKEGAFGADMKVELINDGPVTIIMDTKNKE